MPEYRLLNPAKFPPGGWKFTQIEIGWKAPHQTSENLNTLAGRVRDLRLNNPVLQRLRLPTDLVVIKREIITYNCVLSPQVCAKLGEPDPNTSTRTVPGAPRKKKCCARK